MTRLLALIALVLVAALVSAPDAMAQRQHYNEYDFDVHPAAMAPPFTLIDQWGSSMHTFALYDKFLAPTSQDEDPILDPDLFLTRYFIGFGGEPPRTISVSNKFGDDQPWTVLQSYSLLNPSRKNAPGGEPPTANHYKCYQADGPFVGTTVTLTDQFGSYDVLVTEPAVWCNPAIKRHEDGQEFPVVDPFAWQACYFTDPPSFFPTPVPVTISDQFGTQQLGLVSRELLCVPSLKAKPVPTETVSWGQIKVNYR